MYLLMLTLFQQLHYVLIDQVIMQVLWTRSQKRYVFYLMFLLFQLWKAFLLLLMSQHFQQQRSWLEKVQYTKKIVCIIMMLILIPGQFATYEFTYNATQQKYCFQLEVLSLTHYARTLLLYLYDVILPGRSDLSYVYLYPEIAHGKLFVDTAIP